MQRKRAHICVSLVRGENPICSLNWMNITKVLFCLEKQCMSKSSKT